MHQETGKFLISLDFELMWGVRDVVGPETYGAHIKGEHEAIPRMLEYFTTFGIKGTFATVGLLFFENRYQMLAHVPKMRPSYNDPNLSPYGKYMREEVGESYPSDPYHFGLHLVEQIKNTPGQEIGTHTFSHYYCLEKGQTIKEFAADLAAAIAIAHERGIKITSIIFPRNQVNENYLAECARAGIIVYRSNEQSWLYTARMGEDESLIRRCFRLIDAYVNISGHHTYSAQYMSSGAMVNTPSSRFLRPYSKKLNWLEPLRLRRIKKSMTYAARHNRMYHLWWHPHNFGINQQQNFAFLEKILQHYHYLHRQYGFTSITMSELARELTR